MISTSDEAVASIYVSASTPIRGSKFCGGDWGYERISCTLRPTFAEIVRRKLTREAMPIFMGRAETAERGHVLVQIFGKDDAESLQLIEDLVADELIGLHTTDELNVKGESLDDFEELHLAVGTTRG